MRITNWKYKGNRNIIISNDNIVSGRDQPHSLLLKPFSWKCRPDIDILRKRALTLYRMISYNESYVRESKINGEAIENEKYRKKR